MSLQKKEDLISQAFPKDLNWNPNERYLSLEHIYEFVDKECDKAIQWYYFRKKSKSRLGYILRVGAILAVAVAGIVPIIGEICRKDDKVPCISPAWATVSLALAALLIALDRFGGYTSGWVRYVRTAQRLTILQGEFRLDWEEHRHSRIEENMDIEITKHGLLLCKKFLQSVNLEVQTETNAWAQEFQQALMEVDKQSKPASGE